jgi:hypothetical protein
MRTTLFLLGLVFILGCRQQTKDNTIVKIVSSDSLQYKILADTIVCDMVVRNPYPEDKMTSSWLDCFNHKAFIDSLFDDIYLQKIIAYDFMTGKVLTPNDVRNMEKEPGYSRDIVGKFQFRETWLYNRQNHVMTKKVHSIIFGYETYDENKLVKGYKPLFKVFLN